MAKITNPIRFSKHFGCDPKLLTELGVLNLTLNADVRLFIDPLLLEGSQHKEMCAGARATYQQHCTKWADGTNWAPPLQVNDADPPQRTTRRWQGFPGSCVSGWALIF